MRVKKRIFAGVVCEQEIFEISDRSRDVTSAEKKLRFKNELERAAHRNGIARRKHTRLFNENFSPSSLYSTLTMDDCHEVHTFEEARRIRDLYIRRLKRAYHDAKIIIYMGRGKSTNRIHFHMVSDGIPEAVIRDKWNEGEICRIEHLRENCSYNGVNHGQDYTGLANYLFNHWSPEQGGHRYKRTKNLAAPTVEEAKIAKRKYSKDNPPPAPKGYKYISFESTNYGYQRYIYIKEIKRRKRRAAS